MKVYVLMGEEPDSYDVGTHMAPLEMFAKREDAERVRNFLVGLPQAPQRSYIWWPDDLEIEEVAVR